MLLSVFLGFKVIFVNQLPFLSFFNHTIVIASGNDCYELPTIKTVNASVILKVARTKTRPLAAQELTQKQALGFLASVLTCGLMILLSLNWYR